MTDKEIIKALQICNSLHLRCGNGCPYYEVPYKGGKRCSEMMIDDAIGLINRKTAEIEKLTTDLVGMRGAANSYKMHYEKAQTEIDKYQHIEKTVKDFWSGLKELSAFKDLQEPTLTELLEYIEQTNAEAIKEFAEKICKDRVLNDSVVIAVKSELKEMVGD